MASVSLFNLVTLNFFVELSYSDHVSPILLLRCLRSHPLTSIFLRQSHSSIYLSQHPYHTSNTLSPLPGSYNIAHQLRLGSKSTSCLSCETLSAPEHIHAQVDAKIQTPEPEVNGPSSPLRKFLSILESPCHTVAFSLSFEATLARKPVLNHPYTLFLLIIRMIRKVRAYAITVADASFRKFFQVLLCLLKCIDRLLSDCLSRLLSCSLFYLYFSGSFC